MPIILASKSAVRVGSLVAMSTRTKSRGRPQEDIDGDVEGDVANIDGVADDEENGWTMVLI